MTVLLELADRCEAASGADHLFDAEIAKAVGWLEVLSFGFSWQGPHGQRHNDCPRYTTSLDAAMQLAEGFGGQVTFFHDGTAKAYLWQPYPLAIYGKAANAPLALCAAALRARAQAPARKLDKAVGG